MSSIIVCLRNFWQMPTYYMLVLKTKSENKFAPDSETKTDISYHQFPKTLITGETISHYFVNPKPWAANTLGSRYVEDCDAMCADHGTIASVNSTTILHYWINQTFMLQFGASVQSLHVWGRPRKYECLVKTRAEEFCESDRSIICTHFNRNQYFTTTQQQQLSAIIQSSTVRWYIGSDSYRGL